MYPWLAVCCYNKCRLFIDTKVDSITDRISSSLWNKCKRHWPSGHAQPRMQLLLTLETYIHDQKVAARFNSKIKESCDPVRKWSHSAVVQIYTAHYYHLHLHVTFLTQIIFTTFWSMRCSLHGNTSLMMPFKSYLYLGQLGMNVAKLLR